MPRNYKYSLTSRPLVVAANVVERQEMIGLYIFVLRSVNLKLAYHKGQLCRSVDWIGVTLHFCNHEIIATTKQDKCSVLCRKTWCP